MYFKPDYFLFQDPFKGYDTDEDDEVDMDVREMERKMHGELSSYFQACDVFGAKQHS